MHKCISSLAKEGLIAKVKNAKCMQHFSHCNVPQINASYDIIDDGYRLTYGGLDYLALNAHRKANRIYSLGNQIGVGKESDIHITASPDGRKLVLKLHRLGRISFRSVKTNRDYLRKRSTGSWMYLSRLAAQKEHAIMQVLYREGFAVPEPIAWSRHTVLMEFVDAFPLRMVESVPDPGKLYAEIMHMIVCLAQRGLIHGDFNEFNILIKEEMVGDKIKLEPILIDFPQTVSTNHINAPMYFDRDVACIKRYFERRFKYTSDEDGPFFTDAIKGANPMSRLDIEVEASGFSKKMGKELDRYVGAVDVDRDEVELLSGEDESDGEEHIEDAENEVELGVDEGQVRIAPVEHDLRLSEHLESFSERKMLPIRTSHPSSYGLVPLDMPVDADAVVERGEERKKAKGWSI